MCIHPLHLFADATAPNAPWWVTPLVAVGSPVLALLVAEFFRKRTSLASGTAELQIKHLESMAALANNERNERHKMNDVWNDKFVLLQREISDNKRMLEWVKSAYSELYYTAQRQWDHFEAFLLTLRTSNPGINIPENALPPRPDIARFAPINVFQPPPESQFDKP